MLFCLMISITSIDGKCASAPEKVTNVVTTVKGKNSIKIKWKKTKNAQGYVIQQYSAKKKKYKTIKTIYGGKKVSWTHRKLKKNSYHRYQIRAFRKSGKKKIYGPASEYSACGVFTGKSAKSNVGSINYVLEKPQQGIYMERKDVKNLQVNVKLKYPNKKPANTILRWYSSDPLTVSVDQNGKITANRGGKAEITCMAHNGVVSKLNVYVKLDPNYNAHSIPIITFHRVVPDQAKRSLFPTDQWVASQSDFEQQIKYLADNQFNIISLDEFYRWYTGEIELPENSICLTDDDGYYETYHIMYPIIKKYNMKMTAFIVGGFTGETTSEYVGSNKGYRIGRDVIAKIRNEYPNFEFQNHSYMLHHYENNKAVIFNRNVNQLYDDFKKNESYGFTYYAYPYGFVTPDMLKVIPNTGTKMAFGFGQYTYATRDDDKYNVHRVKIHGNMSMDEYILWVNHWK